MAEVQLVVTIPNDPDIQAKMLEAVNWMSRNTEEDLTTPNNLTPAQAKAYLEARMKEALVNQVKRALRNKAEILAEGWSI